MAKLSEEMKIALKELLLIESDFFWEKPALVEAVFNPPKSFSEFEDRLLEIEEKLRNVVFGLSYDTELGKTLKREKSNENIVTALCNYEKYVKGVINEQCCSIGLLKLIIEKDAPFLVCDDEYILGVKRDRSGLSLPQKNKIAIQAAAQVFWYLEKNKIPTIDAMTSKLRDKKNALCTLWEINKFGSRAIEDWICEVFPIPVHLRKGRPSKSGLSESYFDTLITIPEIFLEDNKMINFLKLKFAIISYTQILKTLGWSIDQIKDSIFIQQYKSFLKFYLWIYVKNWIEDTAKKNSSIFDQ